MEGGRGRQRDRKFRELMLDMLRNGRHPHRLPASLLTSIPSSWLQISKPDFVVTMTTFLFTAMVNIEVGLVTGIVVSICVLLQELSEIHTSTLVPIMSGGGRYIVRRVFIYILPFLNSSSVNTFTSCCLASRNQSPPPTPSPFLLRILLGRKASTQ